MKRDQRAYLASYYQKNRAAIRRKQRESYEAKYERVSKDLLHHLRAHPAHALGRLEVICPDCERLGPFKTAVCLECGRYGLAQLPIHLREAHKMPREDYLERHGLNRGTSLTSAEFHATRSRLSSTPETLRRLKRFTPATARSINLGRRHTLRKEAIESRKSGRAVERPKQAPCKVRPWSVALGCLEGKERKSIARELKVTQARVNKLSLAMGFTPGRPARYFRGEAVTDRFVRGLMRDARLSPAEIATRAKLPVHRVTRALSRPGRALQLDVADALLAMRRNITEESRRTTATPRGGHPKLLLPSESGEILAKYAVLVKEFRYVASDDDSSKPLTKDQLSSRICTLARQGKASMLLRWMREFMEWRRSQAQGDNPLARILSPAFDVAREFLAEQFGISARTLKEVLSSRSRRRPPLTDKQRRIALDLGVLFGERGEATTEEILAALGRHRDSWRGIDSHKLAQLVKPFGAFPKNIRISGDVRKGYALANLRTFTTAEVAQRVGFAYATLKQYISRGIITAPPMVRRMKSRGRVTVRSWTHRDIERLLSSLGTRKLTLKKHPSSATASPEAAQL